MGRLFVVTLLFVLVCMPFYGAADEMCFEEAGAEYNIAPELLRAISWVESNHRIDAVHRNGDNSYDVSHMQINVFWKKYLKENWKHLKAPCYATRVGAWILRQCMDRYGETWDSVACYNTGQSISGAKSLKIRQLGEAYVKKVQRALERTAEDTCQCSGGPL